MSGIESLRRTVAPMIDHQAFGPMRASPCERGQWVWESLELLDTDRGKIDLAFEAGPEGPGVRHRAQLSAILALVDSLTRAAAPLIFAELAEAADNRWTELVWRGAYVTGREGEFRLEYSCRNWPDSMITAHFEGSTPAQVDVEN